MTTTALPAFLPTDDEIAAEEAALAAEDAAARPLTGTPPSHRRDRVARILAAFDPDGSLGAPPRSAISPRPRAASLLAWAGDPVATLPPLRLRDGADPGDLTRSETFTLASLARTLAPDLAERGWRISAGSLVLDGARRSPDDLAETASGLIREAVAAVEALKTVTEPAPSGASRRPGTRDWVPSAYFADRLERLSAHMDRAYKDAARLGTPAASARAQSALYRYNDARSLASRRPAHDGTSVPYVVRLRLSLGDLTTPRARRTFAASVRALLPVAEPGNVPDLTAARAWLVATFTPGTVVPRADLWRTYEPAGTPGNLDRTALLALAVEVFGQAKRRATGFVHLIPDREERA